MSEPSTRDQGKFIVRMPEGMRDDIKRAAVNNGRSMNAEIVHRIKLSLETEEIPDFRLSLPEETANALVLDAIFHGVSYEERAAQIISKAYDKSAEYTKLLHHLEWLAGENTKLDFENREIKLNKDIDFILYYSKLMQVANFYNKIISEEKLITSEITEMAKELSAINNVEIAALRSRHEELKRIESSSLKFLERERQATQEIVDSESNADDDT